MTAILAIYGYGAAIALWVYLCRSAGRVISPIAIATVFMHEPSRRNGIPWLVKAVGKSLTWPVVLGLWLSGGREPSPVLFGAAAALRLGRDPDALSYHTNGFATMWKLDC